MPQNLPPQTKQTTLIKVTKKYARNKTNKPIGLGHKKRTVSSQGAPTLHQHIDGPTICCPLFKISDTSFNHTDCVKKDFIGQFLPNAAAGGNKRRKSSFVQRSRKNKTIGYR